jgi:PHP family Zn ribbon phosphoesterase
MLKIYTADLHIHSCLSPCGDLDMSPRKIVATALERELDIIAITDHNSSENIIATIRAAYREPLTVFAGMEITSEEEAHLIALFDNIDYIEQFQKFAYDHLISFTIDKRTIEDQVIVNENDEVEGFNDHLLLGATSLSFQQLVEEVHRLDGLAIASHVDKESFSIIAQLGFIPEDLKLDALEISPYMKIDEVKAIIPDANRFPLVTFSDAHYLTDIAKQTTSFLIKEPTIKEIKMALTNSLGRKVLE